MSSNDRFWMASKIYNYKVVKQNGCTSFYLHWISITYDATVVMAPERLGAMHQTHQLHWELWFVKWHSKNGKWRNIGELDAQGFGHVIYKLATPNHVYHLVVFAMKYRWRTKWPCNSWKNWDVTFALVLGDVDVTHSERLRANVPLQADVNPNNVLV